MSAPAVARTTATPGTGAPAGGSSVGIVAAPPERSPIHRVREDLRASLASTPGKLGLLAAGVVIAALLAGVLGAFGIQQRSAALDDARAAADQLVLLQQIRNDLVQADADATTAFLVGGLEPTDTRVDYISKLADASRELTVAARSAGSSSSAFGEVNEALTRYTGLIEAARANNRQGLQVGAAYLRQASTVMSADILPALAELSTSGTEEVEGAFSASGHARWWLAAAVLLGVGALIAGQVWLARRTHRYLNLPLVLGSAGLAVVLVAGIVVMALGQSEANAVRAGPLTASVAMAQARTAAFDAKSTESLSLINRGSGEASEPAWKASIANAKAALAQAPDGLGTPATQLLATYEERHAQIRALDDAGNWDQAVALATGTGADADASGQAAFTAFSASAATTLTDQATKASDRLDSSGTFLLPLALLVLVLGVLGAIAAWWGVSLRREEYR